MMAEAVYDSSYYVGLRQGSRRSADRVLPIVFDRLRPQSVVDFGCGSGAWLSAARALGAEVFGVDGPWVPRDALAIDERLFRAADLSEPLDLQRRFDLALCLEVAEHLPAAAAATLVQTLARHAPAVLFSAAIPGQGGTGHVNEAWPRFWCDHFVSEGFECLDVVRGEIWADPSVEAWYRQNLLLFVRRDGVNRDGSPPASDASPPRSLVHPQIWSDRLAAIRALEARLDHARSEIERLGHSWQALADEKARLQHALAAEETILRQIITSRSWRLTAPLRWLDHALRRRTR